MASQQLTLPGLDDFTGLTAADYLGRLLDLVRRCGSMDPDRYMRELEHLGRLREAGKMTEGQKQGFGALEGLAGLKVREAVMEREYGNGVR
jgi:hypothetical protein